MLKTWPLILSVSLVASCSYDYGSLQGGILGAGGGTGGVTASGGTRDMGGSSDVAGNGDASVSANGGTTSPPDAPFATGGSGGSAAGGVGGTTRGTVGLGGVSSIPSGGIGGATNLGGMSSSSSRASAGTISDGGSNVTGGTTSAGGSSATGGTALVGGSSVSGGTTSVGGGGVTGGTTSAGGSIRTGGVTTTTSSTQTGGTASSGGITSTGGSIIATTTVTFSSGKASGPMTGYGFVTLGALDVIDSPTCGTPAVPITSANLCATVPNWNSKTELCVTGLVPALPSPATGADFAANWGIQLGVNAKEPIAAIGKAFTTITINFTGLPATGLRAELHRSGDAAGATYCALLTSGTAMLLTSFNTACWDSTGTAFTAADAAKIDKVSIQVSSTTTAIPVTNLCITSITFGN
jgi:hypothetical protein